MGTERRKDTSLKEGAPEGGVAEPFRRCCWKPPGIKMDHGNLWRDCKKGKVPGRGKGRRGERGEKKEERNWAAGGKGKGKPVKNNVEFGV